MASYYDKAGLATGMDESLPAIRERLHLTNDGSKLLLTMVGMPARGKSFIAHKLAMFLSWSGTPARVFNAGEKRREMSKDPPALLQRKRSSHSKAEFFDHSNEQAAATREQIAMVTLDGLLTWFKDEGGVIGIFDATNSRRLRRDRIRARVEESSKALGLEDVRIVFIETICMDPAVIDANMRTKIRSSPDFRGLTEQEAVVDLRKRIANYEAVYETVTDDEGSYIKMYDLSSKVTAHLLFGRLSKCILPFTMAVHVAQRPVYLAALTAHPDVEFAERLARWAKQRHGRFRVFGSTQPAALHAAAAIKRSVPEVIVTHMSALNPLLRGRQEATRDMARSPVSPPPPATVCDEVADALIQEDDDDDERSEGEDASCNPASDEPLSAGSSIVSHGRRRTGVQEEDKRSSFQDRAEYGESYADLVRRLEYCLIDIEAAVDPVLVIAHATPCCALLAYFLGVAVLDTIGENGSDGAQALADAAHTVVELNAMTGGGWLETVHDLETDAAIWEDPREKCKDLAVGL